MLRCFSSLGCPDLSLEQVLALARTHAIDGVELRALGGTVELPAYFASRYGSAAELRSRVAGQGVSIVALATSLSLVGQPAPDFARDVEAWIPWAESLGGVWLRVFDGGAIDLEPDFAAMGERLAWWRALRRERGWRSELLVETHGCLVSSERIRRFLAQAPGTAILWDTHHTWRQGGENPLATWREVGAAVAHIHIKDTVSQAAPPGHRYVLPAEGEFPAPALLAALRAGYRGYLSLEWEKLWHPELPPLDAALRHAATHRWW